MRGSVGAGTDTIIYTRGRRKKRGTKPVRCNCHKCIHAVVNKDNVVTCMVTGDIAVRKEYCSFYRRKREDR